MIMLLLAYGLILTVRTTYHVFENIYQAVINLPKPIRRVCFVQVFAFMGWYVADTSSIFMADHTHKVPILILLVRPFHLHHRTLAHINQLRTTYIGQIMAYENNAEPDKDVATRTGEFAMLIYSIGRSPTAIFRHNLLTHCSQLPSPLDPYCHSWHGVIVVYSEGRRTRMQK